VKWVKIIVAVGLLTGCAHSKFTRTTTINGGIARQDASLPIYLSPPNESYDVIGQIDVETSRLRNPDKVASAQGIARGANALILLNEGTRQLGTYHSAFVSAQNYGNLTLYQGNGMSVPINRKVASYLAIHVNSTNSISEQNLQ
jgi:hypothetical protein